MTGFEFEWRALACRLRCVRRHRSFSRLLSLRFPEHSWPRAAITYSSAMTDLEQVTAFVDVHEELLFKGGPSLEQLLGPKLLYVYNFNHSPFFVDVEVLTYSIRISYVHYVEIFEIISI